MKYFHLFFLLFTFSFLNGQIVDSTFGEPYSLSINNDFFAGATACDFSGREDRVYSMFFLEDGKIMMMGHSAGENDTDFAIARLLPNGQYDQTAGPDGQIRLDLGYEHDSCLVAIRYGTDRILMGGSVEGTEENKYAAFLIKTDFDGNLDSSFGTAGKVIIDLPGQREMITKMQALPNGNIIIAGNVYYGDSYRLPDSTAVFIGRLLEDGSIDSSFGDNGFIYKRRENCTSSILGDLILYPDGTFLITGEVYDAYLGASDNNPFCESPTYVSRYLANGAVDVDFGEGGIANISLTRGGGNALYLYEDGRIIVAGLVTELGIDLVYTFVARLLPNGAPDSTFAENGIFRQYVHSFDANPVAPVDIVLAEDKILIGFSRTAYADQLSYGVLCLTDEGAINTSFGNGNEGVFTYFNVYGWGSFYIKQIQLSTDNQGLYLVGHYDIGPYDNMLISKLNISELVSTDKVPYLKKEVNLYPNPLKNGELMHIDIPEVEATNTMQFQVYDSMGRLVLDKKMTTHALNAGIDMAEFTRGIYFVELLGNDRHYFGKVLVLE